MRVNSPRTTAGESGPDAGREIAGPRPGRPLSPRPALVLQPGARRQRAPPPARAPRRSAVQLAARLGLRHDQRPARRAATAGGLRDVRFGYREEVTVQGVSARHVECASPTIGWAPKDSWA